MKKVNFRIQPARLADCAAVEKIGRVPEIAIAPNWYLPLAYYQRVAKNKNHIFLVAEVDQQIVGFIIGEKIEAGYLSQYVVVEKKYRKQGIGKLLLAQLEKEATRRGAYFLLAYAVAKSKGIQKLHRKLNWHRGQLTYEWTKGLAQRPRRGKLGAPKKP